MFGKENTNLGDHAGKILLGAYLLLSFIFIVITMYSQLKMSYGDTRFSQGVGAGYTQAVNELIQKAQECKPFPVYSGRSQEDVVGVELINIACLQQSANTQAQGQEAVPAQTPEQTEQ